MNLQQTTQPTMNPLVVRNDGRLALRSRLHSGQARAWRSNKRFIVVLAGTQSGKTWYGPRWLLEEIRRCGAGDYLAVTASYDLFKLKMLPMLSGYFKDALAKVRYYPSERILDVPLYGARVILRSAESGGGLESSTAKAAWLDEAGQESFTLETWEAVQRRLSLSQGRALLTTTIYNMGWLKTHIYDRWRAGDPDIDVIQFDSTANPAFPKAEYERARASMPLWKFNMFYRGRFERPAGLIYDSFNEQQHRVPRFAIPADWKRFLGLDFGGVNTAGLFFAAERGSDGSETGRLYLYREYKAGGRTAAEHATKLLEGEPMIPMCVGGSKSEGQWRREFQMGGLPVREPNIKDVEVGIDRVYSYHKQNELFVFDDLHGYLAEKLAYSRVLDSTGEPTEKIDDKSTYHFMDAERYILGRLRRSGGGWA